jgi:hypothetical protein
MLDSWDFSKLTLLRVYTRKVHELLLYAFSITPQTHEVTIDHTQTQTIDQTPLDTSHGGSCDYRSDVRGLGLGLSKDMKGWG